jgi:hypothetical protein
MVLQTYGEEANIFCQFMAPDTKGSDETGIPLISISQLPVFVEIKMNFLHFIQSFPSQGFALIYIQLTFVLRPSIVAIILILHRKKYLG